MNHYTTIAIVLTALGFALLFFVDTLIKADTQQSMLKTIRDQHKIVGAIAIAGAYYMYTLGENSDKFNIMSNTTSDLPSYEDATSDVLNL